MMCPKILSLEIWDGRMTVAEMQHSWTGIRLRTWLVAELPFEARYPRDIARYAGERIREAGLSGDRVVLGLGADQAYVRKLEFPFFSRQRIERALPREMGFSLPMNAQDLIFDAAILGQTTAKSCCVFAAAVPRTAIEQWVRSLRREGLEPDRIDLLPSALSELGSSGSSRNGDPSCTLVWELGRSKSAVAFVQSGRLERMDWFWIGTEDLARIVADKTGSSREEALVGIEGGVWPNTPTDAVEGSLPGQKTVPSACARAAHTELTRSIRDFQQETPDAVVERILLTGRGARWKELGSDIAKRAKIPLDLVQEASLPFDASRLPETEIPEVASAACLALEERKRGRGWNFCKNELASRNKRSWRRFALDIGVGLGILLLCAAISLSFHLWLQEVELQDAREKVEFVRRSVP